MPRLGHEAEINGSQVEKNKEPGHHKKIKRTETKRGTRDHMTGGTEVIWEVTEMQKGIDR